MKLDNQFINLLAEIKAIALSKFAIWNIRNKTHVSLCYSMLLYKCICNHRSSSEAGMLIFLPKLASIITCAVFNSESLSPVKLLVHNINRQPAQ